MNILISEDDIDVRAVLKMILEDKGATVCATSNGEQALKKLESKNVQFDVLVTDFNMPLMNGDELIRKVFSKGIKLQKIIMMTGLLDNAEELRNLAALHSNITFLFKPISPEKLLKAILG